MTKNDVFESTYNVSCMYCNNVVIVRDNDALGLHFDLQIAVQS